MENKLVSTFYAEKFHKMIEDISNKIITNQKQLDDAWYKIFDEGCDIEKNNIEKAFNKGENTITMTAEEYFNETYLQ